ncbi:hypothetical protein VE04_05112 [Pseudogymnoascus sp. 24MN13]|nr:hypothetical protein VE04_05112 [Pseudogymnoascus sp. 24MN13]
MAPCTHVQWLGLVQDQGAVSIHHSGRLQNIANSLPRPLKQYPSTLLFVGKASKSAALRGIYHKSRISNYRNYGIANICLDPKTTDDTYPVLIANASPDGTAGTNPSSTGEKCHETTCHLLDWSSNLDATPRRQDLMDIIQARLLAMFVDVICIFADDCGGLPGVVAKLTTWAKLNSASSLPSTVRPRVLVVTRMPGEIFDSEVLRFRSQLFSTATFSSCFFSLNVINMLPKSRTVSKSDFTALEWLLAQETLAARQTRLDSHTLFSSVHSAALFEKALIRFSKAPKETFNFIRASRDGNMVNSEFQDHINEFLCLSLENKLPNNIPNANTSAPIVLQMKCFFGKRYDVRQQHLEAFGTFQDGGLKYNNPLRPGRRQVQRIWNDEDCDIVLSIGTGFKEQLTSPKAPNVRNLFQDGAIARLYRASMSSLSLDSGNSWKDHWHGLEKDIKGQHFRLDVPLKGRVPNIDEVDQMADLQDQVRNNLGDMDGLARAFKAVSFFFELDEPPL